jgi:hypothetical protein
METLSTTSRIIIVGIVAILSTQVSVLGQTPEWYIKVKEIKLLETPRSDVERLFDPLTIVSSSKGSVGLSVEYGFRAGSMSILYSNGYCEPESGYGYNVEKDVVIKIAIKPKKPIELSRFDFNLSRFEKEEVSDVVGMFTYTNEEDGQELYGTSTKLSNIILSPSRPQEKMSFDCLRKKPTAK